MAYYAGGYYAGGYYAGGLFSTLGSAFKGIAKVGFGALTGGPIGGLKAAVSVAAANTQAATLAAGGSQSALTPALIASHNAALARGGNAVASAPKPSTGIMAPATMAMMAAGGMVPGAAPGLRGFHPNKSTYVVRGGGTSHYPVGVNIVLKGTSLVRNRRMNWGNGRALGRAERRISAFLHHATKYMRWAHPGKAGHAVPKFTKRRKK